MIAHDPQQQGTVGPKIKNEADRLQRGGNAQDALPLIDAAMRMDPPLDRRDPAQLREIREQRASPPAAATGTAATPAPSRRTAPAPSFRTSRQKRATDRDDKPKTGERAIVQRIAAAA